MSVATLISLSPLHTRVCLRLWPRVGSKRGADWLHQHRGVLSIRADVKYLDEKDAKKLVAEEGYTILDIRDKTQYERAHIISSVHIPLYVENTDNDLGTIVNRTLHNNFSGLFYGLAFTKLNPEFLSMVEKKFSKDSKLLLVCQEGLRSAAAADKLEQAGYKNIAYISSGLQKVKPGLFEKKGPRELKDAGKAGLVTIQGKISVVLGTGLIGKVGFDDVSGSFYFLTEGHTQRSGDPPLHILAEGDRDIVPIFSL